MRDKLKDKAYFNEYISEENERIINFTNKLINNEVKENRVHAVKTKIHDLQMGILIVRYSKGDAIDALAADYVCIVKGLPEVWQGDYYEKNLWIIAIGVLLNMDELVKEIVVPLLEKDQINDWLYNYLLMIKKDTIQDKLLFPEEYKELEKIVLLKQEERSSLLQEYVTNIWYKAHKDSGWYDSHKSTQNLYFGYWCFEGAAIAKILNILAIELRESLHYPYDMVHFC